MHVLNSTFIECGDCGNFVEYDEKDIQCTHELHDESAKIYSYKITYIECEYCNARIILNKERISPGT